MTTPIHLESLPGLPSVLSECLGYLPKYFQQEVPPLSFGDSKTNFDDRGARTVADEQRTVVSQQLAEAYAWCASRFPLSIRRPQANNMEPSITGFTVGHSKDQHALLSSSSPQAPGLVFMAADWPLKSPYRLASLIAHESIHQALYLREFESSPVRAGSLGYSPWRGTLRPGRWVWHAFWTFTCQSTMLSESLLRDQSILRDDPALLRFIADMVARVSVCLYSLELSSVVSAREFERCSHAVSILNDLFERLAVVQDFDEIRTVARNAAFDGFQLWARAQVSERASRDGQVGNA